MNRNSGVGEHLERGDEEEPSWAERVLDVLRRIFVPEQPEVVYVPVPVVTRPRMPARRRW